MMPPISKGVNFPQMDSVNSLKGKKAFMDFTGGFLVAPLEQLAQAVPCNFVLLWQNVICIRMLLKLKGVAYFVLFDLQH